MDITPGVEHLIAEAIREDVGSGDVTSQCFVRDTDQATAHMVARQDGVLSGRQVAEAVFHHVDRGLNVSLLKADGQVVKKGEPILTVAGSARSILGAERVALNFIQRMTGIATLTRQFVERASGTSVQILDTRKTMPGLRALDKYAVRCGGGQNHRMGLYDRVMMKDNHLAIWQREGGRSLAEAVCHARARFPNLLVEIEVDSMRSFSDAVAARPDWVLLDNMSATDLRACVAQCAGHCQLEASGGITLETIDEVLQTGIDAISLGALTHSAPAADIALDFET